VKPGRNLLRLSPALALLLCAALASACGTYRLIRRLDPDSKDFISKVRYLITAEERKTFLNLPASEREAFMDDFWKKRDPDPDTEENEFKTEYYNRIDEANHLFTDGQEPGWLQDRGRIYILLGPPDERWTYPRGMSFYGIPVEIWYYGFFPIYFIDPNWTGNYRFDPDNPVQLTAIMQTQLDWKPHVEPGMSTLDFNLNVEKMKAGAYQVKLRIPYVKIWMTSGDNKELRSTLTVTLLGEDAAGKKIEESSTEYPLALTEEKLEALGREEYVVTLDFAPKPETKILIVTLANGADGSSVSKRKKL
jgi:GWxTD domain-containing protein